MRTEHNHHLSEGLDSFTDSDSIADAEYGKIYINRMLMHEELCSSTEGIEEYYMQPNCNKGLCFGSALFWATESLNNINKHKYPVGIIWKDAKKYKRNIFHWQFYDFSNYVHKAYTMFEQNNRGFDELVRQLNHQEIFLSQSPTGRHCRLRYTQLTNELAKNYLQKMLMNSPECKNTAIVLGLELQRNVNNSNYGHTTVLLNFNTDLFFFDVNEGVYHIVDPHTLHWSSLTSTIANSFGLNISSRNRYELHPVNQILIEIVN